jgi:uncharacterized membrane protein YhdT
VTDHPETGRATRLLEAAFVLGSFTGGLALAWVAKQEIGWPGVPLGFILGVLTLPVVFCAAAGIYVQLFPDQRRRRR